MSSLTQARAPTAALPARPVLGGRRAPRLLLLGLAVMAVCALGFAALAARADPAVPVLSVARQVAAGAVIADADLQVVRVVPAEDVAVIPEGRRSEVVGRTAGVPLAPGSLLSPSQLGAAAWPPTGSSVVAVPVEQLPAGLQPGARASVVAAPATEAGSAGPAPASRVEAVVVAIEPATTTGTAVVSLLVASAQVEQVAATGDVVLVLESPQRGG